MPWPDPYGWARMTGTGLGVGFCNPESLPFFFFFKLKSHQCAQTQHNTCNRDPDRGKRVRALRRAAAECAWQMPPRGTEQRQALQKAFRGRFPGASPSWQRRFILTSHGCLQLRLLAQPIWRSCHVGLHGEQDRGGKKGGEKKLKKKGKQNILVLNASIFIGTIIKRRVLWPCPCKTFVQHLEGSF